jgi:hypothetical protein
LAGKIQDDMRRLLYLFPLMAAAAAPARAQLGGITCEPGVDCPEVATQWGAWGLIALGLMFLALWLMPVRLRDEEEEQTGWTRLSLLRLLQRRFEKERTGWRNLQWPVLALFFLGLGLAYLLGWR